MTNEKHSARMNFAVNDTKQYSTSMKKIWSIFKKLFQRKIKKVVDKIKKM